MKHHSIAVRWVWVLILSGLFLTQELMAQGTSNPASTSPSNKKVDVESIKKQYWRQGEEVDVVQNRLYSKKGRMQIGLGYGFQSSDPFLDVNSYNFNLGFHFNEYISVHALYWKENSQPSRALEFLERDTSATANTNIPSWYTGGELGFSLIYGKLSLFGARILYFDMMALAGTGITKTESGSNLTLHAGFNQQIYLSQHFAFLFQYRLMHYKEDILNKNTASTVPIGTKIDNRSNFTTAINVGISVLF